MGNKPSKTVYRYSNNKKSTIVAIITARGGSKRLPNKNILNLAGKPLIAHTIEAAINSEKVNNCYVSTENEYIKNISLKYGAEIIDRPVHLAADNTLSKDVVKHSLNTLKEVGKFPYIFILLQPTSPLRNHIHINSCIELFLASKANSCVSVALTEYHPYKAFIRDKNGILQTMHSKESLEQPYQLLPNVYRANGAIYIGYSSLFLKEDSFFVDPIIPFVMEQKDSLDIDTIVDFQTAEYIINNNDKFIKKT